MRVAALLLLILLLAPMAYAQTRPVIAIYSPMYPVDGLADALNDTYSVEIIDNLTRARGADVIIILGPLNVSYVEQSVIRGKLKSGGLVILTSEPRNDSVRKAVNGILKSLGLPTLVYDDVIYDFIRNAGDPMYPKVDGYVLYSSSLVNRTDALRRNYTMPSGVAMTNESVRETGRIVRGEAIKVYSGELVIYGGTKMFSDEKFNDSKTRFDINGRLIINVINEFLKEAESKKEPSLPLIDKYLMYIAIALFVVAIIKTIKSGRP